jgi:hypothetical protein
MKSTSYRIARIVFGVIGLLAVLNEIVTLMQENVFSPINFFSYFTILSNVFAGIVLIYLGVIKNTSTASNIVRGAVTLYMLMTGIIFAVLLAGIEGIRLTAVPIDNIILHYLMPIILVLDWIIAPPNIRLSLKALVVWVSFPIVYVVYTVIRGAHTGWYPYPFFDPAHSSNAQVATTIVLLTIFVVIAAVCLRAYANMRYKKLTSA